MKTHHLIAPLTVVVLALLWTSTEANTRSERSIREWFSNFMKRFQRKESRQEPFYLRPAHPSYFQAYGPSDGGGNYYDQFQHDHFTHQNSINEGHGFGGHNSFTKSHESDFHHQAPNHVSNNVGVRHSASAGNPVYHNVGSNDLSLGFGPLKNSDVIDYAENNRESQQIQIHPGIQQSSAEIFSAEPEVYEAPSEPQKKELHTAVVQGIDENLSYEPPSNSIIQATPIKYSSSHTPLQNKEGSAALEPLGSQASSLIPASPAYQISSSASSSFPAQRTVYAPSSAANNQLFVSGQSGQSYFAPQLGPDDPIIEIVFQDGDPLPPPPPPVIDESLYAPASDDVEVYFIEYSPDDNIEDLKNLDLSGAQPAILQNLPTELPPELREHLITSGVLENAEIEILDLDSALTDQSLDVSTRNALRQAYTRTNRQAPSNIIVDNRPRKQRQQQQRQRQQPQQQQQQQPVDIRVKRLNHDANTPEGIVEFLSGLKSYRKGTYAGVVDVNDRKSDKYIPVEIDGRSLPVPDNIPLDNKKVEGVLVFSGSDKNSKTSQTRRPKSTFSKNTPSVPVAATAATSATAATAIKRVAIEPNSKRMLDIQWADMESNGWIPIVNS